MKVLEIKLDSIKLSENTRKDPGRNDIADLKNSIESVGLIQPIGLKEVKGKYELIYGFRRLEAFKQLKRETIPAVIFKDVDSSGLKIIENLQRKDITPLELATAIKKYQVNSKLTFNDISKVLGKSIHQISQINKLNDLYEPLKKYLEKGSIELDAAYFVARYPIPEQKEFFNREKGDRILISDAKRFFEGRNYRLSSFPWLLDKVFNGLPVCSNCTDRSSQQGVLFPEHSEKDDTCLNSKCFEKKIQMNLQDVIKETVDFILVRSNDFYCSIDYTGGIDDSKIYKPNQLRKATEKDEKVVFGITVKADRITDIGKVNKYVIVKEKTQSNDGPGKKKIDELSKTDQLKRRIENYKRKKELILFPLSKDITKEIYSEINNYKLDKKKGIPIEALALVAEYVRDNSNYETRNKIERIWNPKKDKNNLNKMFLLLVTAATYFNLENETVFEHYSRSEWYKRLKDIASILDIDIKSIEKKYRPKYDEKLISLKENFILRNKIDPEKPN